MKILLAEDTQELAKHFIMILEELGAEVEHVIDGLKAIEKFKQDQYDLIICDHNMPNCNGDKVYSCVRELNKNILFVHFSSYPCPERYTGSSVDTKFAVVEKTNFKYIIDFVERLIG